MASSWQDGQQIILEQIMPFDVPYDIKGDGKECLGKRAVNKPTFTKWNLSSADKTHCSILLDVAAEYFEGTPMGFPALAGNDTRLPE